MRYYRRVIHIRAEDSPNVRLALEQRARGEEPTGKTILPGVLSWADYLHRRATWDKIRQCVGLDGQFYEGSEILMFPPEWLSRAEGIADRLIGRPRRALGGGCDPAEGGDETAMAAVDQFGLIELVSFRTPDTSVIPNNCVAFMKKWSIPPEKFCFDRGGGGYQHVCELRNRGYKVRSVGFGESLLLDIKSGKYQVNPKREHREERYVYLNRRAEMFGLIRQLLDPVNDGWGIPAQYQELRRQLAPIPLTYDKEGRLFLLPKHNPKDPDDPRTLKALIGCSPDQADSVALAVFGMVHKFHQAKAGVA